MAINTGKVTGRRTLHFQSLAEVAAEAERLAAAPHVQSLGNWNLGQTLGHLAEGFLMSLDGSKITAPWYIRLVGPLLKGMVLKEMRPGFKLPAASEQAIVPAASLSTAEGLARFREAFARYGREPQRQAHGVFGKMTPDEWDRLQMRHAELHFSFHILTHES